MELNIESLGGMCPCQGYGTLNGERLYFRYRHDDAQLYVGPPDPDQDPDWQDMPASPPRLYAEVNDVTGDLDRGWLDCDDAVVLIHRMIPMLRPPEEWRQGTYTDRLRAQVEALTQAMQEVESCAGQMQRPALDDNLNDS